MSAPLFPGKQGFTELSSRSRSATMSEDQDAIPLQKVVSTQSTGARRASQTPMPFSGEKSPHSFRRRGGLRKRGQSSAGLKEEEGGLNIMGKIYNKVLNFSLVTRYFLYLFPLGLIIALPIIFGATVAQGAMIGGVRIVWFFTWVEVVWISFWVTKLFAKIIPYVFEFLVGIVSSKIRKYALLIKALETPISFIGWALVNFLTFQPLMTKNPTQRALAESDPTADDMKNWETILQKVLAATLVATIVFFAEKLLVQLISVSYHNKQFGDKIKENKRQLFLMSLLYDESRRSFPEYCHTFAAEDTVINDSLNLSRFNEKVSGSATPMKLLHNVGRLGDNVTSAFGKVAQEMTGGAKIFDSNTSQAIVAEALEKPRACEALAKRIWMSFVMEGNDALLLEDIIDVLGEQRHEDAYECFSILDRDANGDVSLDEMVLTTNELGRSMKSIASSKHDVDQAIKVLDRMLSAVVFVVVVSTAWSNFPKRPESNIF
jgi:Ca2+-binding EF-hand superfamily protein